MSMISYTVKCDWPKCKSTLHLDTIYFSVLRDWRWEHDERTGMHLCKEHGHKTWEELEIAMFEDEWEQGVNDRL